MAESWMYTAGQRELTGPVRAELDALLEEYGVRWHVIGRCLDGSWYAWPRGRPQALQTLAVSLTELATELKQREADS